MTRSSLLAALVAISSLSSSIAFAEDFLVNPPVKIQAAINAALASGDTEDTIFVNPGVYDEAITIDFSGTTQQFLYIIHNTTVRPIITQGVTVRDARLVTLDGFEVRSSHADNAAAAIVRDTVGAAFVQCVFAGGDFGGVDADDSYEVVVNDCSFGPMDQNVSDEGGFGVRIEGRSGHRVLSSDFKDDEGRSIWIEADSSEVTSVVVDGAAGDSGIFVSGLGNVVKKSNVKNCEGDGIRVSGVCEINDTTVQNNGSIGIRVGLNDGSSWTGGLIKKCTIKGNDSNGILVESGQDGLAIRSSTISGNSGFGVRLKGDGGLVRDNTITKTSAGSQGGHGVIVESSSDRNFVRSNKFSGNSGNGVVVQGDTNYVLLNTASDSDGYLDNGTNNAGRSNKTSGTNDFD